MVKTFDKYPYISSSAVETFAGLAETGAGLAGASDTQVQ